MRRKDKSAWPRPDSNRNDLFFTKSEDQICGVDITSFGNLLTADSNPSVAYDDRLWQGPINNDGEEASFRQGELCATAMSRRALVLTP